MKILGITEDTELGHRVHGAKRSVCSVASVFELCVLCDPCLDRME